jgi:hypothetical protein
MAMSSWVFLQDNTHLLPYGTASSFPRIAGNVQDAPMNRGIRDSQGRHEAERKKGKKGKVREGKVAEMYAR